MFFPYGFTNVTGNIYSLHYLPRFFFDNNWDAGQGRMLEDESLNIRMQDGGIYWRCWQEGCTVYCSWISREGIRRLTRLYHQMLERRWTVMLLHDVQTESICYHWPVTCVLYNTHKYKFWFIPLPLLFSKKIIAPRTTILNVTIILKQI